MERQPRVRIKGGKIRKPVSPVSIYCTLSVLIRQCQANMHRYFFFFSKLFFFPSDDWLHKKNSFTILNHVLLFLTKGKAHNVLYKTSCKVERGFGVGVSGCCGEFRFKTDVAHRKVKKNKKTRPFAIPMRSVLWGIYVGVYVVTTQGRAQLQRF